MRKQIRRMFRREKIFGMIRSNPGISGYSIWMRLTDDSRAAKRFGRDSLWTAMFGVPLASIYPGLDELEKAGRIRGEFVEGPYPRKRVYFAEMAEAPR